MPEPGSQPKLKELEERWQTDRSPRVFLPLADELRKAGRLREAIAVLTAGLEHHADSVSGQVALGRCLLDAGEVSRAAGCLESALERDPTQLVANKLLAESRLRLGDAAGARERLVVCRLLGGRDADVEEMERRVAALAPVAAHASAVPPIFELAPPAALPGLRFPQSSAGTRRAANPFGALLDPTAIRRKIAAHLASEGIFAIANAPSEPEAPLFFPREAIGAAVESESLEPTWSLEPLPESASPVEGAGVVEPAASVTLAALYLEQGHLGEAESEYRRVLAHRPDDAAALAGLDAIVERRSASLPVAPPIESARRPTLPGGLTQRKIARLRGLLDRLQRQREAERRVS